MFSPWSKWIVWKLTLCKICMQVCLNLWNVPFWLCCYLFLTSRCRRESSCFMWSTTLLIVVCLKIERKQKLLNFCKSVKYFFLLLFQACLSLFYPGDQQLPDSDVFSSLIWCTLDVNVSVQKTSFLPCVVFLPIHRLQTFILFSFPRQYGDWFWDWLRSLKEYTIKMQLSSYLFSFLIICGMFLFRPVGSVLENYWLHYVSWLS